MIVGIDFSLTGTGVCAIKDGEAECVTIGSKKEDQWFRFPDRVIGIVNDAFEWVHSLGDDDARATIAIESPAFLAKGSGVDRMFGGWWIVIDQIWAIADPLLKVTPAQVKKFATGNGNAKKDEVMLAVARRYPDVPITDNNQSDALVLAAIAAAAVGEPFNGELTKAQREVVEAVSLGGKES